MFIIKISLFYLGKNSGVPKRRRRFLSLVSVHGYFLVQIYRKFFFSSGEKGFILRVLPSSAEALADIKKVHKSSEKAHQRPKKILFSNEEFLLLC